MPINKKQDFSYLWDMREAAREIVEFIEGTSYDEFSQNKQLRYAVERQLLVIGEAANHVSDGFKKIILKFHGCKSSRNAMF